MKRRHNNSAGFTLMEVVVAITLMSLIMLTLVMGLRLTANAWNRGEQKLDEQARRLSGADALSEQISAAAVRVVTEQGANNEPVQIVAFAGSPSELRFCTRRSWRGNHSRPQYMADYRVVQTAAGRQQLVISENAITDDASVLAGLRAPARDGGQPVGDPADKIELMYFQPATPVQPAQWVPNWQPLPDVQLPPAVRVVWMQGQAVVQQATFPVAINHVATVH